MKRSLGAKTLALPTPVWLVGTYDDHDRANLATVAWGGICCSDPPCVAISLRKARHSYASIINRTAFTVNIPSEKYVAEADFAGIASGKNVDKFAAAGLTAEKSQTVDAPLVREFPLILECRLIHTIELGIHTQFIGEIIDVKAEEDVLAADGVPTAEKVQTFTFDPGGRHYMATGSKLGLAFSVGKRFIPE